MISEVQEMMNLAFNDIALGVDGSQHYFGIADGNTDEGKIYAVITVLWVQNQSVEFHTHTHGLNTAVRIDERRFIMNAADLPKGARLYANDFIDIDSEQFKISQARIRDGLWEVTVKVLGSL
jgi:hypothetical protein